MKSNNQTVEKLMNNYATYMFDEIRYEFHVVEID
jgi:hypothetical protein